MNYTPNSLHTSKRHCIVFFLISLIFLTSNTFSHAESIPGDSMIPWAGGSDYYAQWSNGPPTTADFFPIAVWLQSPESTSTAQRYKEIGINMHIGLWEGPTETQLSAIASLSSMAICDQNSTGLQDNHNAVIKAWLQQDEPDNARTGTLDPVPTDEIISRYQAMVAQDNTRPVYLNLGQGVASDPWYGRGNRTNHPEDYPQYAQGADILSFDIYPMNTFPRPDGAPPWFTAHDNAVAQHLEYVALGVQRLRQAVDDKKPVWAWIETTNAYGAPEFSMEPYHLRAEVWMALIHGAMGIGYFCHQFTPNFIEAGLLADPTMTQAAQEINSQIKTLAPVLNTQSVANGVTVHSSNPQAPVATMVKRYQGSTYVFAVSMRPEATDATFTVRDMTGVTTVEVLDENRRLNAGNGVFTDHFNGYQVHLYAMDTGGVHNGALFNLMMPILIDNADRFKARYEKRVE
jgi:hypothetical protein